MKGLVLVIVLSTFVLQASAQGGGPQKESLRLLGRTSNADLVDTSLCNVTSSTTLRCPFTNSEQLIVDPNTGVALREVKFQICLCDSALTINYTLTNDTEITHPCNQCPVEVLVDRLRLSNDFTVFKDDFNITSIGVLVELLVSSDRTVTVFNHTLSLSQQAMDCPDPVSPPRSCNVPTTTYTPQPTTTTGPSIVPQGTSYKIILISFFCVVGAVILIAVFILVCICIYCWQAKHKNSKDIYFNMQGQNNLTTETTKLKK